MKIGLITDVHEYSEKYCAQLQPYLTFDGLYMAHVEPWLDPNNVENLWHLEGLPESVEQRQRLFASVGWEIAYSVQELLAIARLSAELKARRSPLFVLRFVGAFLLRFTDRQFAAVLFQLPPRSTRFEPCSTNHRDSF